MSVHCPTCDVDAPNSEVLGVDVRGVYDGVLYWVHSKCGRAIPRWPAGSYPGDAARVYIDRHNSHE
jgi:hypothetical protein